MRVQAFDRKKGIMKVKVESEDDLWHISNIVLKGCHVSMRTARKVKVQFGERTEIKKTVAILRILVEKVEYHPYLVVLRISGKITDGKDEIAAGDYHTMNVEVGSILVIEKQFGPLDIERIERSRASQPKFLIVLIDRDEALFALVRASGVEYPSEIYSHLPPKNEKGYESSMKEYLADVSKALAGFSQKVDGTVIAGPGNVKDNLADYVRERHPDVRFSIENASSATKSAVKEIVMRQTAKGMEETNIAKETKLVERLFLEIAKGDRFAYGLEEVKKAAEYGAVGTILVSDKMIRDLRKKGTYGEFENMLKGIEKRGAELHIISSEHEAGSKLDGLGGVAALLRFRIS